LTFYKTVVAPHLDYCASILFLLTNTQIEELQKVQNKFMRILLQAKRDTHIKEMLDKLEFLSVKEQIEVNVLKLVYKIENLMAPKYLTEKLISTN
jgi:hypothetical protein